MSRRMDLVMKLPRGLREQPGWVYIGLLCALAGLSYVFKFSTSSVTDVLDPEWMQVWGGFLFVSGSLVAYATIMTNRALERLSLRLLALGLVVYMGWIIVTVPDRAAMAVAMCLSLIIFSQIRVAMLGILLEPPPPLIPEGQ